MEKKKTTKTKFLKVEKVLIVTATILLIMIPITLIFAKAILSESNIEVEKLKDKIETQEATNESLVMQINELASLTNIQTIAKEYGLSYNNDNIRVIKRD